MGFVLLILFGIAGLIGLLNPPLNDQGLPDRRIVFLLLGLPWSFLPEYLKMTQPGVRFIASGVGMGLNLGLLYFIGRVMSSKNTRKAKN